MGNRKVDLVQAQHAVCEVLSRNIHATNSELAAALGVCATTVRRVLNRLLQCGSEDTKLLIQKRNEEVRMRWWSRKEIDPGEVLRELRLLAEKLGRVPRENDVPSLLFTRAVNVFGSWNAAIRAAGLGVNRFRLPRDRELKRELLLDALRKVAEKLGRVPKQGEYREVAQELDAPRDPSIYVRFFGSWEEALGQAGLIRTREDVIQEEVERLASLGRRYVSVKELPRLSSGARKALKKALGQRGITVVHVTPKVAKLLSAALERGFPVIDGLDRGRAFAIRLASGRTFRSIAADAGITGERVRQLAMKYLRAAAGSGKVRRRPVRPYSSAFSNAVGESVSRGGIGDSGQARRVAASCEATGI
ncbi:hypothetical protein SAMN00808754_1421 [Thermanaeromonas toyohensis ToBE]|uniref:Uncharacterized protein n=2 Tax=Thermanaeromonas TaxID=202949 RepID=A0A1W1VSE1_9FIRM|nr:hypothetical protein SAMN00808754_1421 [Thermanaeromonas toyohensis ToBE]